uniref:NALCN channel auxiliary factor 1 n=1 Tax=Leptobrachium leishanense TaxID=445787 RepID=A0A8C5LMR9_9ANUR
MRKNVEDEKKVYNYKVNSDAALTHLFISHTESKCGADDTMHCFNDNLDCSAAVMRARGTLEPASLKFTQHKTVYKSWLCSQYFEVTQFECSSKIPCKQYCLEVQTRCPFILPDNDDVVYGGLSSFICTGLYDNYPTNAEPECCDVRWELLADSQSKGTKKTHDSTLCHRTSLTVSSASRLCNSRLKLCVLVLILLHTVLIVSAAQNSTGLGFGNITVLEDNSTNEE